MPTDPLDDLTLRIVKGQDPDAAARAMKLSKAAAKKLVDEARRRITLAASFHRDEQLGLAIKRLNHLYARAEKDGDLGACVHVQKELNRLLDLYRPIDRQPEQSSLDELTAVREYLEPLALAGPNTSTVELARLAAARLTDADRLLRN